MTHHEKGALNHNIDILIIVNMFLTGFDSKKLLTLYVDKNLQWHSLLQAFARTNRIEKDTKPFGNIVSCNLKEKTRRSDCVILSGDKEGFLVKPYADILADFKQDIIALRKISASPDDVDKLYNEGENALAKFVESARSMFRTQNQIRFYEEFKWAGVQNLMDQATFQRYQGKYLGIQDELRKNKGEKVSILDDIDFETSLLAVDQTDVKYIVNLIKSTHLDSKEKQANDIHRIRQLLNNATSDELRQR